MSTTPVTTYAPGTQVRIRGTSLDAEVLEDRGPLGIGGEHVFRIRLGDPSEAVESELSASYIELLPPSAPKTEAARSR